MYLYLLFSLELHMKQIKSRFEARSALQVVIHKRAKQFHAFDDIFSACFIPHFVTVDSGTVSSTHLEQYSKLVKLKKLPSL